MLVLTRRPGETIHIGNDVVITVVEIDRNKIKLGISAPRVYDGFGAATVREKVGISAGEHLRLVEVEAVHADWQRQRYWSGGYQVYSPESWADCVERGLAVAYPEEVT